MTGSSFFTRRNLLGTALAGAPLMLAGCASQPGRTPDFREVDNLFRNAVSAGYIPGAVVAIGRDDRLEHRAVFGHRALVPVQEPETWETLFDMASLTKATVTAPSVLQLMEQGRLQLDDPVVRYFPAFAQGGKSSITIRHLLTHFSGLPPDVDLSTPWTGKSEAVRLAMASQPAAPAGSRFIYSDINFIVLGLLVEKLSGLPLNVYATQNILAPLGMKHSFFLPDASLRPLIAPTQYDEHQQPLRGVVHDPTARRMGGVAGHAGLFSCAHDMVRYAQNLLDRRSGRPSSYPLTQESVLMMTMPQQPGAADQRGLGWDIASHYATPRGDIFPVGSFGHTGYTGTSLWMDPSSHAFILILTNRVHPFDLHTKELVRLRHDVATAAARALGLAGGTASRS